MPDISIWFQLIRNMEALVKTLWICVGEHLSKLSYLVCKLSETFILWRSFGRRVQALILCRNASCQNPLFLETMVLVYSVMAVVMIMMMMTMNVNIIQIGLFLIFQQVFHTFGKIWMTGSVTIKLRILLNK